jgi:hypothetical protein
MLVLVGEILDLIFKYKEPSPLMKPATPNGLGIL